MTTRNFAVTIFDEPKSAPDRLQELMNDGLINFYGGGLEKCPTTKRKHWQGFVQFCKKKTIKKAGKLLWDSHVSPIKGSKRENEVYCAKSGNYVSAGVFDYQGKRKDIECICDNLDKMSLMEIVERDVSLLPTAAKYEKFFDRYRNRQLLKTQRWTTMNVIVIYGPPGCGKSRYVSEHYPNAFFKAATTGKWFDGYDDQTTLVLDEWEEDTMPRKWMNLILDGYNKVVEVKGGTAVGLWDTVIIITNDRNPKNWYKDCRGTANKEFTRRVTEWRDMFPKEWREESEEGDVVDISKLM